MGAVTVCGLQVPLFASDLSEVTLVHKNTDLHETETELKESSESFLRIFLQTVGELTAQINLKSLCATTTCQIKYELTDDNKEYRMCVIDYCSVKLGFILYSRAEEEINEILICINDFDPPKGYV